MPIQPCLLLTRMRSPAIEATRLRYSNRPSWRRLGDYAIVFMADGEPSQRYGLSLILARRQRVYRPLAITCRRACLRRAS